MAGEFLSIFRGLSGRLEDIYNASGTGIGKLLTLNISKSSPERRKWSIYSSSIQRGHFLVMFKKKISLEFDDDI